jgi:hypothetical protein
MEKDKAAMLISDVTTRTAQGGVASALIQHHKSCANLLSTKHDGWSARRS